MSPVEMRKIMAMQTSDTSDRVKVVTPQPAIGDEQHVIEHWASVLSFWVMLVYPTAAIVSYYGISVAYILITHVDLTVVVTMIVIAAIQLIVVWISATKLEPHLQYTAEICKTLRAAISFKNEAGTLDWIQASIRYMCRKLTQTEDSAGQN